MTNIKDVAKQAGVSIATVSNVFNNPEIVSPATIERVRRIAEALQYRPNRIAQGLVGSKTRMVGVVVPDINNLVYAETVKAIESVLRSNDYSMLLFCTEYDFERSQEAVRYLLDNKVDGVIFSSSAAAISADCITQIIKHQVPVVGMDIVSEIIDLVSVNVIDGVFQAMKHLIELGHRRVGFISGSLHNGAVVRRANQRFEGYIKALQQSGLPIDSQIIHSDGTASFDLGEKVMREWIQHKKDLPTAVLAARDDIANGIMVAASSCGMSIPGDISVIGYANYDYSRFSIPPLTTIDIPTFETGRLCAELLLKRIKNPVGERERILLPSKLVLRSSTAAPRVST
ncbi:MAG: LacI family transcriptional regulator [Angelakisella sp.]|jgi:LacI family transcriptional regulator|nr:LacI family transcriptional regulator [Angelakisella sp.]